MTLADIVTKVKQYSSTRHASIERVTDQLALWTVANAGLAVGLDRTLNYISQHADHYEGLAMAGTYTLGAAAAVALNTKALPALSRKLRDYKRAHRKPATAKHFLKDALQIAAITTLAATGQKNQTVENYTSDAQRVIHAFERPALIQPAPLDTIGVPLIIESPVRASTAQPTNAGALTGKKLSGLYADIVGYEGIVPAHPNIDFCKHLGELWSKKAANRKDIFPIAVQTGKKLSAEYCDGKPARMTLNEYSAEANKSVLAVRNSIDWSAVQKLRKLSDRELDLVRNISNSITGTDLLAYGFTELLPSADGEKNKTVIDFVLRNAGRDYLESIPALYDPYTSFGPYQFTQFAVNANSTEGASRINQAVNAQHQIPGSVAYLRGNDHHKAAYMFAIDNLATLAHTVGKHRGEFNTLEAQWATHHSDIVKYMATAHHNPAAALKASQRWLDNGAKKDFTASTSKVIHDYSIKTAGNLTALSKAR